MNFQKPHDFSGLNTRWEGFGRHNATCSRFMLPLQGLTLFIAVASGRLAFLGPACFMPCVSIFLEFKVKEIPFLKIRFMGFQKYSISFLLAHSLWGPNKWHSCIGKNHSESDFIYATSITIAFVKCANIVLLFCFWDILVLWVYGHRHSMLTKNSR